VGVNVEKQHNDQLYANDCTACQKKSTSALLVGSRLGLVVELKKGCGLKTGHTYQLPTSATGGPEAQKRRFLAATVA
jgi:hypothetical protein